MSRTVFKTAGPLIEGSDGSTPSLLRQTSEKVGRRQQPRENASPLPGTP